MPPEPLPWDRREGFFKDHRKHERRDALGGDGGGGGFSSAPRWRDPYHGPRDLPRASPRRPLSGHYRQGGGYQQVQLEDSYGHGCSSSRSERLWSEYDGFRSSSSKYGGGHRSSAGGTSRENRGYFRRSPQWNSGDLSSQHHHESDVTPQRSVATPISSASQIPLKDQNGKTGSGADDGLDTGHIIEHRDHYLGSTPWKKWSRSATVTLTRTGRSDSQEAGLELILPSETENPIGSPATSSLPPEELALKKKPRLGWGQGLAKYEKQKVGPVGCSHDNGKEPLSDSSQRNSCTSGCLSPSCSANCSSSPDTEDKFCSKVINNDNDTSQTIELLGTAFLQSYEEVPINLDQLEVNPLGSLDSFLSDMFQSEDTFSSESTLTSHSAMTRLSTLKDLVSNGLEKIEFEIESLEKELKSMDYDSIGSACQTSFKLNDVSKEFNIAKQEVVENAKLTVEENAPDRSIVEEDAVIEDINDIVSSKISSTQDLTRELSDLKLDKQSLLPEVERKEVSKLPLVADTDSGDRLLVSCGGAEKNNCVDSCGSSVHVNPDGIKQSEADPNLMVLIMDSNRNAGKLASKMFDDVLPRNPPGLDMWGLVDFKSCLKNNLKIKEKLAARKSQLKFKEKVATLKFRVLHFLWKEDLHLMSIRKFRSKSGKRVELNHSLQSNSLKQRTSIRSPFSLPGNLTLVPTTEIVNFTSKLLSDSQVKFYRNDLMMPALLLDENERKSTKFITQNGLVEDPPGLEKERAMINPWSHDEREIFMEMLAQVGKDFTKISSVLSHKTTADCIEFYYKNHKSESFKEVKKQLVLRRQQQSLPTSYLVGSGKIQSHELNASVDMLGVASFIAAHSHGATSSGKNAGRITNEAYNNNMRLPYGSYDHSERASIADISMQERESTAADTLLGISSEAVSSCITSSADPSDKMNYAKMDQMFTSELSGNQDEKNACSDGSFDELDSEDWTDEEKSVFIKALGIYGKNFTKISMCMKTRSREQCKIFFSKARKCLSLDAIQPGTANGGNMPLSDANGESDTDDICVAEMDSAICSTQSCSQVDLDSFQSVASTSYDEIAHAANIHSTIETNVSDEQNEGAFMGLILEGTEENTDNKQVRIFPAGKILCQDDNLQSDGCTKESFVAVADCTDCVVTDAADRGTKVTGISSIVSQSELVVKACTKSESKLSSATMILNEESNGGFAANGLKKKVDIKPSLDTKVCLPDEDLVNIDFRANGNSSCCSEINLNACGAPLLSENKAGSHNHLSSVPRYQQQLRLDLLTRLSKNHRNILMKQAESRSVSLNSFFAEPFSISFGRAPNGSSCTTSNFGDQSNKHHPNIVKGDLYQQYMLRNLPVNQVDYSTHPLRGYPLQAYQQEVKKEVEVLSYEKPNILETDSKNIGAPKSNDMWDMKWKKSNIPSVSHSRPHISYPSRTDNQSEAELKSFVKNTCSDVEEQKTGDVKLFGKILCNTSSLQKSNSSSHEDNARLPSPKIEVSPTMNYTSNGNDGNRLIANTGVGGQVGLEEQPVRTFGLWDTERMQIGFSSLSKTAGVLARYQEPLAGAYSATKDGVPSSHSVLTEYCQSYMPQLSSDGNWLDRFSERQKRNGPGIAASGCQQQGRASPLVGGGVLDPVAALKLHYAAAARAKVLSSEMESWRGDVGGR